MVVDTHLSSMQSWRSNREISLEHKLDNKIADEPKHAAVCQKELTTKELELEIMPVIGEELLRRSKVKRKLVKMVEVEDIRT